jgi:homoserine kinase
VVDRVTVRAPATSANLGPGFDCLGLALGLTADVTITLGAGNGETSRPIETMAAAAARAAYRTAGRPEPKELTASWKSDIPLARGLGASAAARAGGIVGANALMGEPLSADELLALGASLEGHADNMAPALFGGLQVVVQDGDGWRRLAVALAAGLKVVLLIPDLEMPTQQSRQKLPQKLSREEAVFNVGRAALLVAAFAQGRWELLNTATQDKLHQPARAHIFSALYDIFDAAKEAGAHAAYLSGGGSTVAALVTEHEERVARLMHQAAIARGFSARTVITEPSAEGARVIAGR